MKEDSPAITHQLRSESRSELSSFVSLKARTSDVSDEVTHLNTVVPCRFETHQWPSQDVRLWKSELPTVTQNQMWRVTRSFYDAKYWTER